MTQTFCRLDRRCCRLQCLTKETLQHQAAQFGDRRKEMNNKEKDVELFNLVKACMEKAFQQRVVGQKQLATRLVVLVGAVCNVYSRQRTNS